jgi:hypothetical protein
LGWGGEREKCKCSTILYITNPWQTRSLKNCTDFRFFRISDTRLQVRLCALRT